MLLPDKIVPRITKPDQCRVEVVGEIYRASKKSDSCFRRSSSSRHLRKGGGQEDLVEVRYAGKSKLYSGNEDHRRRGHESKEASDKSVDASEKWSEGGRRH